MINDEKIIDLATKINDGFNKFEVELVPKKAEKKGFFEYYSCKNGKPMGAKNFSWSAALY